MSNKKYIKIKGKKINKDHLFYAGIVLVVALVLILVNSAKNNKQISYNPVVEREILKQKQKKEKAYFSDLEEKNEVVEDLFSPEKIRERKNEEERAQKTNQEKIDNKKTNNKEKETTKQTSTITYSKAKNQNDSSIDYFNEYSLGTETSITESISKNSETIKTNKTYIKGYIKYNYNFQYGKEKNIIIVAKENINKKIKAGAIFHAKAKIDLKDRRIYANIYKIEYENNIYNITAGVTEIDKTQGMYANIDDNKAENILKTLGNKTIDIASSFNPASNLTSGFTNQVKMKMSQVTAKINKRKEIYIKMR